MEIFKFEFSTSHHQFYIADKSSTFRTDSDNFWTNEAVRDKLAIEEGILGIVTQSYSLVKGDLQLLDFEPIEFSFDEFDYVVEGSIVVKSGVLQILPCLEKIPVVEIKLVPKNYRLRIYSSNLDSVVGDDGDDYYSVRIWPKEFEARRVLKRFSIIFFLIVSIVVNVCGQSDTLSKMIPDNYSVTNDMLDDKTSDNSSFKKKSGEFFSFDKVWFTNDTLKQTLVFELYTDYHRLETYHFYTSDIPNDIINKMELRVSTNKLDNSFDTASFQQKKIYFNGFIDSAKRINQSFFTTKKNFNLGDKKQKAVQVYGNPDKCSISENIEKCEWKFEGDQMEYIIQKKTKDIKQIAKDSFGHTITMFFKNGNLIAMILSNDIP